MQVRLGISAAFATGMICAAMFDPLGGLSLNARVSESDVSLTIRESPRDGGGIDAKSRFRLAELCRAANLPWLLENDSR